MSAVSLLLVFALYLGSVVLSFNQIDEDAFIYLRIAANIADGHGYVFNIGGEHIESGSSLLWQLMLVPLQWLPIDPIISAKLLGIGFGCLALTIVFALSRLLIRDAMLRIVPSMMLAVAVPFFCWSQRGMETALYLCALLALCYVCIDERWWPHWYLPAIVVFCARPEGFIILVGPLLCLFVERARTPRFWSGLAFLVLACGGVTLARLWYFHDPFPHSFQIKAGGEPLFVRVSLFVYHNYHLALLAIPLAIGFFHREFWNRRVLYLLSFIVMTGLWISATPDFKPYNRHGLAFIAFFNLVSIASLDLWMDRSKFRTGIRVAVAIMLLSMLPVLQLGKNGIVESSFLRSAKHEASQYPQGYFSSLAQLIRDPSKSPVGMDATKAHRVFINTNYQATTGTFIRDNYPENITFAYDQMGQTPWYAGRDKRVIDTLGLASKTTGYSVFTERAQESRLLGAYSSLMVSIAGYFWPHEQRMVSRREAVDYVFDADPELILINTFVAKFQPNGLTARVARDPRIRKRYRRAYVVNGVVTFYERNDIYSSERTRVPPAATVRNLAKK